jgi:DNA-binding transcriptional LysR family regulator
MNMLNETALRKADLNLLLLFQIAMRERHVGRTAAALHVSPSAVSHGLRRLRELLGDPLFLRTPKGVVPTARAEQLAEPIGELLSRADQLLAARVAFNPATVQRRFVIGTLDAPTASFLPPLLARVQPQAPHVSIETMHVALADAFAALDAHRADLVVLPLVGSVPARFEARALYEEDFVVVARTGHPIWKRCTLQRYCEFAHVLVSPGGGARGFVDDALQALGLTRHVAAVVPNFLLGMALLAECDLIGTMPRRVVELHAKRFGLSTGPAPLALNAPGSAIYAAVPKVSLLDAGIAWLFRMIQVGPGLP